MANFEVFLKAVKVGDINSAKNNFDLEFPEKNDENGLQPIHWACLSHSIDILKWMLEINCKIESPSKNGWRPIHFASFIGNEEMVKILIENYCKLECQTDNGETISDVANGKCDHEFIDKILNGTNLKVGLSMGLKCGVDCDHKLCLSSVIRGKIFKDEFIGCGDFGKVYKVKDSQNDQIFAVKIMHKHYNDFLHSTKHILSNNQYLTKINHNNIVKYYGLIKTLTKCKIFMEYMDKGSIEDEVKSTGALSEEKIALYSKDIFQAVAFLHHNNIIHRDIKPSNILIDNNRECKLSISHLSRSLTSHEIHERKTICGTANYMAPEIANDEPQNYPVDIWSVGATVIHMLTGHSPYHWMNTIQMIGIIGTTRKLEYKPPHRISNEMQKFIDDMLKPEPNERATADELLNHKFIRNVLINCEINNSNTNQSIIDYSLINRQKCIDYIENAINNHKIGLSMGLACSDGCDHQFCLSSVTANKFQKGEQIGSGSFGEVFKITTKLVIKTIKKVHNEEVVKEAKCLEYDVNQYRDILKHENIVKYFGAINNTWTIYIFMEFIDGGSISSKISEKKYDPLPVNTIKLYTRQILIGLQFLHGKNIIHRDIRGANILITKQNCIKIADFGLSRFLQTRTKHEKKTFCGTVNYMSPEVANDEPYGCPADIWSVGATVFEMATGHPPFHSITNDIKVGFQIITTRKLEESKKLEENEEIKHFIDLMTKSDPNERWTATELLNNNYLK